MKRKILVTMLAFALSMACMGCAKEQADAGAEPVTGEEQVESEEEPGTDVGDDSTFVGMGNPWTEGSVYDLLEGTGIQIFIPEAAENPVYRLLESDKLAEVLFTLDGLDYCLRVKPTEQTEDISGLYYEWTSTEDVTIGDCKGTIYRFASEDEMEDAITWYDAVNAATYSLSVWRADGDTIDLKPVAEEINYFAHNADLGMNPEDDRSSFVEVREDKNTFASYEEIIGDLQSGEAYAYVELEGYDGKLLLITQGTYDNLDGNMAAIEAYLYGEKDGKVTYMSNFYSGGTAYPLAVGDGLLYCGGNHDVERYFVSPETGGIMYKDYVMESFDEDANASYYGFVRESNSFDSEEKDLEGEEAQAYLTTLFEELQKATVIGFTVVE